MSVTPRTTREQLTAIVDVFRRSLRHFWKVCVLVVIGAGLSILLAMNLKQLYQSETILLYQEKISQSILQGKDVARSSRKQSARYKEMLTARRTLSKIVDEFALHPAVVEEMGTIAATDLLRKQISFRDSGAGTFKITYIGSSAEEAQQVTARLGELLRLQDEEIRREQALQTKSFLENEKAQAENTLSQSETEIAAFLTKHPEFVKEMASGVQGVGASIKAERDRVAKARSVRSPIAILKQQKSRLERRIRNPDAPLAPVVRTRRVESPQLQQARGQLAEAKRNLDAKSARFTPKHPDVIAAKSAVKAATSQVKRLVAAEAPRHAPTAMVIKPTTSTAALKRELASINAKIAKFEAAGSNKQDDGTAERLVNLETEHTRLERRVREGQARLDALEARVFTASITASSEFAEAAKLVVIDKAFLPAKPAGKSRKIVVVIGTFLFGVIGAGMALGLALLDDRIFRRGDIDRLGIAPVLVVIPRESKKKKRRGRKRG